MSQTYCTAFPINQTENLWMTALHCVTRTDEETGMTAVAPLFIEGHEGTLYKSFPAAGVAIVYTPGYSALAFKLDDVTPFVGEKVEMSGYGMGLPQPIWFHGDVALVNVQGPLDMFFNFYNMTVCHGHSGSPVLDEKDGKVMGVMQILLSQGMCGGPSGGTTLQDLRRETGAYWE
jgi:V8-like Glu-specific endopeptidase